MLPRPIAGPVVACLLGLALPVLLQTAPAHARLDGSGAAPSDPPEPRHAAYSEAAFGATNDLRRRGEVRRLDDERCLRQFAREQAREMAASEKVRHQDLRPVLRSCGLDRAGENLAFGYRSGEAAVEAWAGSPSHRANLLEPAYELMAVVSRRSEDGTWYVAQLFGSRR